MQQIQIEFQAIANVLETREKWLQVCFHSSIGLKVKPAVKWKVTDIKSFPNLWLLFRFFCLLLSKLSFAVSQPGRLSAVPTVKSKQLKLFQGCWLELDQFCKCDLTSLAVASFC